MKLETDRKKMLEKVLKTSANSTVKSITTKWIKWHNPNTTEVKPNWARRAILKEARKGETEKLLQSKLKAPTEVIQNTGQEFAWKKKMVYIIYSVFQ